MLASKIPQLIEDVGTENVSTAKAVYLVTLAHPKSSHAQDGTPLKPPSSYQKKEIIQAFLSAMEATNSGRITPLSFELLCVFREKHASEELHDHVATKAQRGYRFMALKRYLLQHYGLASHWSCSHDGYHTCISYGYEPNPPHKSLADLDKEPERWALKGVHPPLEKASKGPVTGKAIGAHRESARLKRLDQKKTTKFEDIDLWPIVIRENILDSPVSAEMLMGYAKRCGGEHMVKFCFRQWDKLPQLIQRCWKIERVEDFVAKAHKSRVDVLRESAQSACVCGGCWGPMARELLEANGIPPGVWCEAMMHSMVHGRSNGTLVCH
eukprot:9780327-Karenia_brevis.AAC.1